MRHLTIALGLMVMMTACSTHQVPEKWASLKIANQGLVQVEKDTDENGYYAEYKGISREELLRSVSNSLVNSGYLQTGTAFDGTVIGFVDGSDMLAVKVDQFGDSLYLAIFNENGKEPLLHGVLFGKYPTGETVSGDEAKEMLLNELESR